MAHNPIVGRYKIGITDNFVILENQIGLLYKNHRFERQLNPGDRPTMSEKVAGKIQGQEIAVYVVDLKPHNFDWRVTLPTSEDNDYFSTNVRLTYRVCNPNRMIDNDVTDTEVLLTRYLETELRRVSRRIALHKHATADAEFTDLINQIDLRGQCGIDLTSRADVQIYLSNEQKKRVQELMDIERGLRVSQIFEFKDEVPSKDTPHRFEVYLQITYRVSRTKQDELPSSNLDEVAINLKPRVLAALRKVSRRYSISELAEADEGMQEKLDESLNEFNLFGLEVMSVSVSCDLNETARKRYLEKLEEEHSSEMKRLKMQGVQQSAEVINGLIQKGNYAVLAMAVARDEIKMETLYERLSDQQREQFEYQMRVLDKFTEKNLLNEDIIYKQVARVAEAATDNVTGIVTQSPTTQLESGRKNALPEMESGDSKDQS